MNFKAHARKTLTLLSLLLVPPAALAQTAEQTVDVDSEITRATVFTQGAQVTREAATTIPAGVTVLTFAGITSLLDTESIQVKADGDFTVLSVVHRNNFFEDTGQTDEAEQLLARKALKQDSLKGEEVMRQVYQQEEEMLVVNKSIGGSQTGVQVAELISAADFFRERLMDIKAKQLALDKTILRLQQDIAALDRQLNEINANRRNRHTSEITVTVTAERQTQGRFELSYLTPNAGWYPHYDIRVKDIENPITLAYNANVQQNSDEDWDDVKLTLSTGDPRQSGTRPHLSPWRLGFYQPRATFGQRTRGRALHGPRVTNPREVHGRVIDTDGEPLIGANVSIPGTTAGTSTDSNGYYRLALPSGVRTMRVQFIGYSPAETMITSNQIDFILAADLFDLDEVVVTSGDVNARVEGRAAPRERAPAPVPVVQTVNTTTVEFEIELPYTIPPDGKPYAVKIEEYEIPSTYEYYCAPKIDTDAFLTALVTGWEEYYLLNGEANLFFEGTFVGQSFLDVENVSDTLVVSLGRDKGVVVERTKLKEFSKRQLIGSKQTASFAFEIEVRNTKHVPIRIVVDDQIPLSTDKRIEVESEPDEAAAYSVDTGRLRWRLDLPPATTETLGFSYAVKYPKDRNVLLE